MTVTETLDLDIAGALRGIDKIASELASAVTAFRSDLRVAITSAPTLVIDIDDSAIRTGITTALGRVDTSISIDIDEPEVTRSLNRAIAAANTSGITIDIDAAAITRAINTAIGRANTNIGVTANAGAVTGAINAAIAAANNSITVNGTANINGLGDANSGMTVLGGSLKQAGTALAAFAGVDGLRRIVDSTSDLQEATTKSEAVFKSFADEAEAFAQTAPTTFGQSTQQALEAVSTFGNFFTSSGLAIEESFEMSKALTLLGSDLASFNNIPVDEGLTKLRAGLAGEIEPLRRIGISITEAEAQAKALELGLVELGEEADQQTLLMARYALIMEKSGNAQGDFARTSDNLANQQRILAAQFQDLLAVIGIPLVSPLLSLLQTGVPILGEAAAAFGEVAGAILPALDALAAGTGPAFTEIFRSIGEIGVALGPGLTAVAIAIGQIVQALQPLIDGFTGSLVIAAEGFGTIMEGVGLAVASVAKAADFLFEHLGPFPEILGVAATAFVALTIVMSVNPLVAFTTALIAMGVAFNLVSDGADAMANKLAAIDAAVGALESAFFDESSTLRGAAADLAAFDEGSREYLQTASAFARAGEDVALALLKTGLSAEEVNAVLADGNDGFREFTATAIKAGQIKLEIDGVEQTGKQIRNLEGDLANMLREGDAVITQGEALAVAFNDEQLALQSLEQQQLALLVVEDQLTQKQVDRALATAEAAGAGDKYAEALRALAGEEAAVAEAEEVVAARLRENADVWGLLTTAIAVGGVATTDYQAIADDLGLTLEDVAGFADGVITGLDQLAADATSKLPGVSEAIAKMGEVADARTLIQNLKDQQKAIAAHTFIIQTLLVEGNDDIAQLLIDQGPEATAGLVESLRVGGPKLKAELEAQLEATRQFGADNEALYRNEIIPRGVDVLKTLGEKGSEAYAEGIELGEPTIAELNLLRTAIETDPNVIKAADRLGIDVGEAFKPGFETSGDRELKKLLNVINGDLDIREAAGTLGLDIGDALGTGFGEGIVESFRQATGTLLDELGRTVAVAKGALRIESPSRVFFEIGEQVTQGLALGISSGARTVDDATAALARGAISSAGGIGGAGRTVMPAGGTTNTSSVDFGGVHVTVTPAAGMSQNEAAALGSTIGAAAEQEIRTQMRLMVGHS